MIVLEQSPFIVQWASRELNCDFGNCYTLTNIVKGEIGAVVVLNNFKKTSVEMSIIVKHKRGLSKEFVRVVSDYVFNFCKLKRITAFTSPENQLSIRILEKTGFKREGLQRCAADGGGDLIMYGILKEECRWLHGVS